MVRGFLAILVACEIKVMMIYYSRISDIAMNSWVGGFLDILVACEIKVMMIKATTAAVAVAFVGVICAFAAVFALVRRSPDPMAACTAA